jgi:hypothetical protein
MRSKIRGAAQDRPQPVAGNGLLDHRALFRTGVAVAASAGFAGSANAAKPLQVEPWMRELGAPFSPYGQPSHFEGGRASIGALPDPAGTGSARTPLHALEGTQLHRHRTTARPSSETLSNASVPGDVPQFPPPQRPILQKDEVFFVGDPILALAAVDETTAADALEKVKIGPALVAEATRPT